jgi:hypothetical protein
MDLNYIVTKFGTIKEKAYQGDFEVWLKSTFALFDEVFKFPNARNGNFKQLVNDYDLKKIIGMPPEQIRDFRIKAIEYIDEAIQYLSEQIQIQKSNASIQASQQTVRIKELEEQLRELESRLAIKLAPVAPPDPEIIVKKQLPFGTPPPLFWSIFSGLVVAAYFLGQNIGSSKFDKEKIQYYNDIQNLTVDTSTLHYSIRKKDSIIKTKSDSLSLLNDRIGGLIKLIPSNKITSP